MTFSHASPSSPAAVVIPSGGPNGLTAIRLLGRRGIEVFAVGFSSPDIGHFSRYGKPLLAPEPLDDEAGFVGFLEELAATRGQPLVVFAAGDPVLNAVARNASSLGDSYLWPAPEWEVLERIQDKAHQIRTAQAAGIPAPRTNEEPTGDFGFPVLVKPAHPDEFKLQFGRRSLVCRSMAELDDAFERSLPFGPLVQELIPGGDDELYTFGAYISRSGEPLGIFSGRKLRQTPPQIGICRVGEARWVDEVVDQGLSFVRELGFHGICQVEFKRDPRDGQYKLMEINPRLWWWHGLAAACGVDVVNLAYDDVTGRSGPAVRMHSEGLRWASVLEGRTRPALLRPPYVDSHFARDDPRPAFVHYAQEAQRAARFLKRAGKAIARPGRLRRDRDAA